MKIFLDTAIAGEIREYLPTVDGLTTNPTLMRKAGVRDYERFAREFIEFADKKPISLEVIGDTHDEVVRQGKKLASWGKNVFVKVPIVYSRGADCGPAIRELVKSGVQINVTAVMHEHSFEAACEFLRGCSAGIISVFAGRIADTSIDPIEYTDGWETMNPNIEMLWASVREIGNIVQAEHGAFDIITVTPEFLLKYRKFKGKDLLEYEQETAKMFFDDAVKSGFTL